IIVVEIPGCNRLDIGGFKKHRVHLHRFSGLAFFSLRGSRPVRNLIVIEILDFRRHEMSRDQGVFCKVQRQAEVREYIKNLLTLLYSPIPMMLMGLDTDSRNRNSRLKTALYQYLISLAGIKIINNQYCPRITFSGFFKDPFDQFDPSHVFAYPGDPIIIFVKYRHDHYFIYYVPSVNRSLKCANIAANPHKLPLQDFFIAKIQKPGGCLGMPAKRMAF